MSVGKQKAITRALNPHITSGGKSTTGLNWMLADKGFDGSTSEFYSKPFESYLSAETMEVMNTIRELENNTLSTSENIYEKRTTLDERLFDARAAVKILLSQVSMHFKNALREKLFRQIDLLHEIDDWEEGDEPIQTKSFNTFLRWFYLNDPQQLPNFGLSDAGQFIASWQTNHHKDVLVLEFFPNDGIKWFVTKYYGEEVDHSSGSTKLNRIAEVLTPYQTDGWFQGES